jgi:hypothetical protein
MYKYIHQYVEFPHTITNDNFAKPVNVHKSLGTCVDFTKSLVVVKVPTCKLEKMVCRDMNLTSMYPYTNMPRQMQNDMYAASKHISSYEYRSEIYSFLSGCIFGSFGLKGVC